MKKAVKTSIYRVSIFGNRRGLNFICNLIGVEGRDLNVNR